MKFKDESFNELYEFMKKMDASDDYLMIQVSSLNPGKNGMELFITITGMEAGENGASRPFDGDDEERELKAARHRCSEALRANRRTAT